MPRDPTRSDPARFDAAAATELEAIDGQLATLELPYDEWEVLYRQRLQVERDLRAGAMAGEAVLGADGVGTSTAGQDTVADVLDRAGDLVRAGVVAVVEAATDDETAKALDRAAGPEWRWAGRIGTVVAAVARAAVGRSDHGPGSGPDRRAGEPVATRPTAEPPASGD